MSTVPRPTGKELVRALEIAGFVTERVRGSHHFLRHHGSKQIGALALGLLLTGPGALAEDFVRLRHQARSS